MTTRKEGYNDVKKYVKIVSGHGYGTGLYGVLAIEGDEYVLMGDDRDPFRLYKAHCYGDADTARANSELNKRQVAANRQIGRRK